MRKATQDQDKFILRLPDGMRESIRDAAKRNGRSMNAEILSRLGIEDSALRDQFAGQALIAAGSSGKDFGSAEEVALWVYEIADAMLRQREYDNGAS